MVSNPKINSSSADSSSQHTLHRLNAVIHLSEGVIEYFVSNVVPLSDFGRHQNMMFLMVRFGNFFILETVRASHFLAFGLQSGGLSQLFWLRWFSLVGAELEECE